MYIPLLGRLSITEWNFLLVSFTLSWLEFFISIVTQILPHSVIDIFTRATTMIYKHTSNPVFLLSSIVKRNGSSDGQLSYKYFGSGQRFQLHQVDEVLYRKMIDMVNSQDILEMCGLFGYEVENRVVKTQDDYFLTVHRITKPGGRGGGRRNGRVVYLHHGLLMNSEVWVTMLEKNLNLPFVLYELGYDVWLGNNRGNKYSQKHLHRSLNSEAFWSFSLDEFALYDIPNTIDYILHVTGKPRLTYIGFSQGTAQAFASVSMNPELNDKIDKIIAISPATTPKGLHSRFLDTFVKSSPNIMFLLFSRKILMPSVLFWKRIMYPPLFDTMIDLSNYMLFDWKSENITRFQKLSSYAHLYLTTSTKTVVHWFQIISSKSFQMYHHSSSAASALHPVKYPLETIRVPIYLLYGTVDSLVDIDVMKSQLPPQYTFAQPVPNHEHLDNLWGYDVGELVFKYVLRYLEEPNVFDASLTAAEPKARNYLTFFNDESTLKNNSSFNEDVDISRNLETDLLHRKASTGGSLFV